MKTEQKKRFEAAHGQPGYVYEVTSYGVYRHSAIRFAFEGWQLCEASALERAAKVCDELLHKAATADECAKAIRALMTEG